MTEVTKQSPRIGIIGTGAIGGYYGVMLARAGFDVHFLVVTQVDPAQRLMLDDPGTGTVHALFHQAGIDSQAMANVHQARWHKLVWNAFAMVFPPISGYADP